MARKRLSPADQQFDASIRFLLSDEWLSSMQAALTAWSGDTTPGPADGATGELIAFAPRRRHDPAEAILVAQLVAVQSTALDAAHRAATPGLPHDAARKWQRQAATVARYADVVARMLADHRNRRSGPQAPQRPAS
jgi:hypothetical protein